LDEFLDKQKRTQAWLADQLGVERSYVSLIASGKRQPSLGLALRIVAITGVPLETLLKEQAVA
jgi:transcriptional regulator with XRE-family HTH domain